MLFQFECLDKSMEFLFIKITNPNLCQGKGTFTREKKDERLFYKYIFLSRLCHFGRRIYVVDFITQCIKIESAEF